MVVLSWIWSILRSVLNSIARALVFTLILVGILVGIGFAVGDGLPRNMVLELDLRKSLSDKSAPQLLDLGRASPSVMDIVLALEAAANDARVKGVFMRVGSGDLSIPKAEELRDALKLFKAKGKFVIAHAQSFYSSGLGDYQVAAGADQIWMQPVGTFFSTGTASGTVFLKGMFDKLEAVPQFVQRYEYKNAANVFTETDFTPAHKEASTRILQSWYDSATAEAAADRKLDKAALIGVLEESPVQVEEVRAKGLITDVGYDEDARNAARQRAGAGVSITRFERYAQATRDKRMPPGTPTLALIHAAGEIIEGADDSPLSGTSVSVVGDTYARAFRQAAADRNVKAIVLRVDLPGGSAIASDQILDAVKKAQAAGKPVVVSMGSVAASGGYFISLSANRIVAEPGTLTGSIGVLWGKMAFGKTAEKVGLEARELGVGKNALFLSGVTPWNESQLVKVNAQADAVYADFTGKVAQGRKMTMERVQEIARGRVWTGADAKERGLVDELGGFWTAVANAKTLSGIAQDTRVTFKDYPTRQGFFGTISRVLDDTSASLTVLQGLNAVLEVEPVKALIAAVQAMPEGRAQLTATGLPTH